MTRFPEDAARARVLKAFELLGFRPTRECEHIVMVRHNSDGTVTPLILPNHRHLKGPTLRAVCKQVAITREEFLAAYEKM